MNNNHFPNFIRENIKQHEQHIKEPIIKTKTKEEQSKINKSLEEQDNILIEEIEQKNLTKETAEDDLKSPSNDEVTSKQKCSPNENAIQSQHCFITSTLIDNPTNLIEENIRQHKLKLDEITSQIDQLNASLQNQTQLNNTTPYEINTSRALPSELNRKRQHLLHNLSKSKSNLELGLQQLKNEENFLRIQSFTNLSMNKINTSSEIDNNINKFKLKEINQKKENIQNKLNEMNRQIEDIYDKERREQNNRSEVIKNFLLNFEHDKALAEEQLAERLKKINKHINYDNYNNHDDYIKHLDEEIEQKIQTQKRELREKEENEQNERRKIFREEQLKLNKDRKDEIKKKMVNVPSQSNQGIPRKPFKNKSEVNTLLYKQKEKEIIDLEIAKRKEQMRHITSEEINSFQQQAIDHANKTALELEQKSLQMKELWKERKQLLPKYVSPFYEQIKDEQIDKLELEEQKKIDSKIMATQKQIFAKEIQKHRLPKIDPKLKEELENRIQILNNPMKYNRKLCKSSYTKRRRGKIILKKINPDNYKWKLKLSSAEDEHRSNSKGSSAEKRKVTPVIIKKPLDKPIDYLLEERMKKNKELNTSGEKDIVNYHWDKMLNDNNNNIVQNIENVKNKAELLQQQAENKKQLLRLKGNDAELGEEIGNLYINSIEAKLQILNAINNNQKEKE